MASSSYQFFVLDTQEKILFLLHVQTGIQSWIQKQGSLRSVLEPKSLGFAPKMKTHPKVTTHCSRLKSSMPFKRNLDLQNIPLSKQPSKTQLQIENEDTTWSPQYNLPGTTTNKRRALSLQEVELDGWLLTLHFVLENMYHKTHSQV